MATISRMEAAPGSPDVIVGVISKLLEDLVSRNDQVRAARAGALLPRGARRRTVVSAAQQC